MPAIHDFEYFGPDACSHLTALNLPDAGAAYVCGQI
jgi:hypothetical protein